MRTCPAVVTSLLLCASACGHSTTKAARLSELPVAQASDINPAFAEQRVLVRRFTEARPEIVGGHFGGAGLIWAGHHDEHRSTIYVHEGFKKATLYRGWMPAELPYLLTRSLPGDHVAIADELPDAGATTRWDYVVEGRLLRTRYSVASGFLPVFMAITGVPTQMTRYEFAYELQLYDGGRPETPLLTRTYAFDEKVWSGAYYNNKKTRDLMQRAVTDTVARSAKDLVQEIAKHQGRARRAETKSIAADAVDDPPVLEG